jgi:hypothetical protein
MIFASQVSAEVASWLDRGEHWLRPADRLDYSIRRWLMPIGLERSASHAILLELQAEIGRRLRAEYDLAQPIPPRLVQLLREFERSSASEGIA